MSQTTERGVNCASPCSKVIPMEIWLMCIQSFTCRFVTIAASVSHFHLDRQGDGNSLRQRI